LSKYGSYAELARSETLGVDYRFRTLERAASEVLLIAPHGGLIEVGTSEIAELVAGEDFNLFVFEGLKPHGANRDLHITSHRFDHPVCLDLVARAGLVLSIHGCLGESRIHIGGLDPMLCAALADCLARAGLPIEPKSERYPGRHPQNVCNRGARRQGAQIEVTYDLRRAEKSRAAIAEAARRAIARSRYILRGEDQGSTP
jgi:phage replication-related protein YjqB (UPF0714/DUF867 family)